MVMKMLGPYALFLYGPSMNTDCPVHYECMYTAYRQSDQSTMKYGAAPHTWRNDSDELHELTRHATMTQQASCTQVCMESEGHIETWYIRRCTKIERNTIQRALTYTISIQGMMTPLLLLYCLLR